jgi:hypothetical protein
VAKRTELCRQNISNNGTNHDVVGLEISNYAARSHPVEVSICFNTVHGAGRENVILFRQIVSVQEDKISDGIHVNRAGIESKMHITCLKELEAVLELSGVDLSHLLPSFCEAQSWNVNGVGWDVDM